MADGADVGEALIREGLADTYDARNRREKIYVARGTGAQSERRGI
jgi:endonuclease YncB( thermonuclease family)